MAYPLSRQMAFRIGITIGDVVERDGDLLGDGVNIAARLEGLAEVGGICVSRAVHEQVVNKLSVQFADIGAQEVKNIPTPVHAYMVAMRREDGTYATPQVKKPVAKAGGGAPNWMWPLVVGVVSVVAICVAGFLYFTRLELTQPAKETVKETAREAAASADKAVAPSASPSPSSASSPSATSTPADQAPVPSPPPPGPAPIPSGEKFVADEVPFVIDRLRATLANEYVPGAEHKALAITTGGVQGFVVGRPTDEAAKDAALELCQKRADSQAGRRCEIYAVGNMVVYPHGKPPVPPQPWIRHDSTTERPFVVKDVPLLRDQGKARLEAGYVPSHNKARLIAIGPGGQFNFNTVSENVDEAARRALEICGLLAGVPCMIVAVDDVFVVPVPSLMKAIGFFKAAANPSILAAEREEIVRQLADAQSGWNAVAVGTSGRPGLGLKANTEQDAINGALGNCARRDSDCHVIAIGPFLVGPNN
jgi:adenylate cyclase